MPQKSSRTLASLDGGWTRIIFHLPARTKSERAAAEIMTGRCLQKYTGCTVSSTRPLSFVGQWQPKPQRSGQTKTYRDGICLLIVDVAMDIEIDKKVLDRSIFHLRELAFRVYKKAGCPQKEFWITAQPLWMAL